MDDWPAMTAVAETGSRQSAARQYQGFCVRPYHNGDGPAINKGFNEVFAQQRSVEEWYWKFLPDAGESWITVAVDDSGELIAHFGAVRQMVQVSGRLCCAGQAMDVYRLKRPGTDQQPVFTATVHDFYRRYGRPEEVSFLFGFPGTHHMQIGRDRLGYAAPIPVPVWRRPVGDKRLWWRRYQVKPEIDPAILTDLWKRSAHRYPVAVVRDGQRLSRRYLSRPGHNYIQLSAGNGRHVSAWAVVRQRSAVLEWIDLLWDGEDRHALIELDDAVDRLAESMQAQTIELWLAKDAQAAEVMSKRAWVLGEHTQQLQMTSISFDPEIDEGRLLDSFYFTMGDSDLV